MKKSSTDVDIYLAANGATPGVKSSSRRARSAMSSKKGPSRMKDFLKQKRFSKETQKSSVFKCVFRKEAKKLGAIDMVPNRFFFFFFF